ncbi:MAG: hypothetical protein HUU50_11395 [Candidatus Brocadiae bacterium]|nr:hypothetical protein [Candidatus Brocadiia bacterium]
MVILDDYRYVPFQGKTVVNKKWLPIFLFGIECTFRKKWTTLMLVGAWLTAIIKSILFLLLTQGQLDSGLLQTQGDRYFSKTILSMVYAQLPWFALILASVTGGLISDDLKKGAYSIYFSRPITRKDYFWGKFFVTLFYSFLVVWLPVFLFWTHSFIFSGFTQSPNWHIVSKDIHSLRFLQTIAYLSTVSISMGFLLLMFSCMSKNSRFVTLSFIAIFLVGYVLENIAQNIQKLSFLHFFSYLGNLDRIGYKIFLFQSSSPATFWTAGGILAVVTLFSAIYVYRKLGQIIFVGLS